MSSEIVVPETPNWLKDLEEKREKRLKARLGHEAGAGAPCLKCEDKCPGLDLHFWRKACKICRCPKEEHDVHDDDIYGWAQFQLLGSKPNKIKTKIVLPGKKDEVELEWAPKGQKDTIDKYLKTLPPEKIPVKGSQAAQERKQMLQKQIPIHDIDPSLCHELNEEEVKKMNEYIAHVKKSSVGVGQIVNLSNVIKANLHNVSPEEAVIIASRYSKGVPYSELVKLQAGLSKNLEKLALSDPKLKKKPNLPNLQPNMPYDVQKESVQNPTVTNKFKDINYPGYANYNPNRPVVKPQYAAEFNKADYNIDQKLLEGTNFDPTKTPSQFLERKPVGNRSQMSSYGKPFGDQIASNIANTARNKAPVTSKGLQNETCGFENPLFGGKLGDNVLPNYARSKYDIQTSNQNPKVPRSVKDLMYDTYDPSDRPVLEDTIPFGAKEKSPNRARKALPELHPGNLSISEDFLEPNKVNIGAIQDIGYPNPEIREALIMGTNDLDDDFNEEYSPDSIKEILNNIKLPDCHHCKKPFEENEFVITIDRANMLFHSDCFKCAGCNQNLADNIYFYHKETDNIYCGRDYAKIKGYPRCRACDELIFTKEYCLAENSTFHLKHFCCFHCDTPLAGQDYTLDDDDQPYCLPCFETSKASKCSTCSKVIKPDEVGCNLNGVHFHAVDQCFACIVCSKPLMGKKLLLRNEKLYCSHDCFNSVK